MSENEDLIQRHTKGQEMVDEFLWRFDRNEDYRALACHAALSLILPPSLLKFLRYEFFPHLSWVAEVDLLLSNLCDEASEDVYVMKREARAFLIEQMRQDPQMGEARIEAVNRLLIGSLSNLMREHPGILPNEWRAQNWSAMLYMADRRDEAARALAEAIYRCIERGEAVPGRAGSDEAQAELIRLTRLVRDAAANLRDYPDLVQLAELTARIMADRSGQFTEQLRESGQLAQTYRLPGLDIELPLERLTLLRTGKATRTARFPVVSPLHQLPPGLPDFTGRAEELEDLSRILEHEGVIIQGLGGVGKTATALELARRVSSRYPDAQLYVDLKGESRHPLTALDALSQVISAWQPASKLPGDETELRELYQSVLRAKRALLVLDDAVDAAQIETMMVPPPHCRLIVTSRRRFDNEGISTFTLGELQPSDAYEFLLKLAPRVGDRMESILKVCGGLPLTLRVAGATLAGHPELSVEEYLQRRAEMQEILGSPDPDLWATVSVSYSILTPERQRQWADLVVFPQTFVARDAAIIWKTSNEETAVALSELAAVGLLEFSSADGRYWMHDLLAEFAQARTGGVRFTPAKIRHATHYLDVLKQANDEYLKGGDAIFRSLDEFDREWENIQAAQAWASGAAESDEEAAKLCIEFPLAGEYLLDLRRPPHERVVWLEQAYAWARESNSPHLGHLLGNLGHLYATLGNLHRAIEFYEQALERARTQGDRTAEGYLLNNLGSNYMSLGDLGRAKEFFEHALAVARETSANRTEGQILSNLGIVALTRGDFQHAHELYEQHLSITRQLGDVRGESQALGNLGLAYAEMGEHERAIELFQRQLQITRALGDRKGSAHALGNLANTFNLIGRWDQAISSAEAALRLFEELRLPEIENVRELLARLRDPEPAAEVKPLKVFVSYSHQDEKLAEELLSYLKAADLGAPVEFDSPDQVKVGDSIASILQELVASTDMILILLSAHFLASPEVSESMLNEVIKSAPPSPIVPVILTPFVLQKSWVRVSQCLPRDQRAVTEWPHREDAYRDIAEGLRLIVIRLREGRLVDSPRNDIEEKLKVLAQEYEDIRERMTSGPERTQLMEDVARRMKQLALSAVSLLSSLTGSDSPGMRLAAVVTLEEIPDPQYLSWLADRLRGEKPFIGYHACRALLSAVRNLETTFYGRIGEALSSAVNNLGQGKEKTDRGRTLDEAQNLLREYWTSRFFNPPARIREIGRPLTPADYQELTHQLESKECLIGLFHNQAGALVATHIQSRARKGEIERLYQTVDYYAVDIDVAKEMTKTPFPKASKQDG